MKLEEQTDSGVIRQRDPIVVNPWSTELAFRIVVILAALGIWAMLILSIFSSDSVRLTSMASSR